MCGRVSRTIVESGEEYGVKSRGLVESGKDCGIESQGLYCEWCGVESCSLPLVRNVR